MLVSYTLVFAPPIHSPVTPHAKQGPCQSAGMAEIRHFPCVKRAFIHLFLANIW
jgi:hypothetical protein